MRTSTSMRVNKHPSQQKFLFLETVMHVSSEDNFTQE